MEDWETVSRGHTEAVVRRSPDGLAYAKTGVGMIRDELADERDRLEWLAGVGLPAPAVLDWADDDGSATLTTASLPGVPLSELPGSSVPVAARALGEFLARLHGVPRERCPFERWLAVTVPLARVRAEEGLVDADDFDEGRAGRSVDEVLADLLAGRPRAEQLEMADLVVCHGDACLPNFLADPETLAITGMVDVGRLGVADRHVDLALATRSMSDATLNPAYGPDAASATLTAYGRDADPWRLDFYQLLDELL
ncbi:MAG TPA: APH(3') family aminoglycoside O-phosphotransferase [Nocardioides sp.]|uniref:APH(3') family aminoglycoside O-phosphotransferase n=1 Tax=Nocardioides sp. TaxID=35761 RepID=UPI002E37B357|nr:APH(3') family aminoglycoside O-phosphotransferase [Nocardioides sp.]HEX3929956.1 APH(3') family aminoglycoside O-phosphotransferase [Nocardioides sp.]